MNRDEYTKTFAYESPVFRITRTFFNQNGEAILKPLLKIQINNSEEFWADEIFLKRMITFLKKGK